MSLPGYLNQSLVATRYSNDPLQPLYFQDHCPWLTIGVTVGPSLYVAAGQVMAQQTAASTPDVQTISVSGGSGSMAFSLVTPFGVAGPFAYNISTANLQTALQVLYGSGNITVTGTPGTSYVITGAGALVAGYLPALVAASVSSGLTVSIAHTTLGILNGAWVAFNDSTVAAPAAAPTLTATGSGGTIGAGTYLVSYTFVNAQGETTASPGAWITLTSAQSIQVTSITGIAAGVTNVNFYINGVFQYQKSVTAGATGTVTISAAAATATVTIPTTNTAWLAVDGSQVARGIMTVPCYTDVFGNLTFGQQGGAILPVTGFTAPLLIKGYVSTALLTGLDATAAAQLGKLVFGSLTAGVLEVL